MNARFVRRSRHVGLREWLLALLLVAVATGCATLYAAEPPQLRLSAIFRDHMVLQRGQPVRVWGITFPGRSVGVSFAGQTASTRADWTGGWHVDLEPLDTTAKGSELVVTSGDDSVTIRDVVVGEVWLASGQSNMAMTVDACAKQLPDIEAQLTADDFDDIRFFRCQQGEARDPQSQLLGDAPWVACTAQSVRGVSAAAFFFARKLHQELEVPIGIIDSSRGGTPIEPFIPREAFTGHPTLVRERELGDQEDLKGLTDLPGGVYARDLNWLPGRLFNSRIAPVRNFTVRGAIWYQGESNCGTGEDPRDYQHKMSALISGWRRAFRNDQLPVYFVQLPGSGAGARWPYLREQQRLSLANPHTGMAVTVDLVGGDIHPPNKFDVGERLAAWALAKTYDQARPSSGPLFQRATFAGDKVVVHFAHAESGLMVATKAGLAAPEETPNARLALFEIADARGAWHAAEATIDGPTVVVRSAQVTEPAAVRYGYRTKPDACNLYNRAGLPASPFCSHPELLTIDGE